MKHLQSGGDCKHYTFAHTHVFLPMSMHAIEEVLLLAFVVLKQSPLQS